MERTGAQYQYHHGLQDEGRAADLPAGVQRGAAGSAPRHHRTLLQEEGEHGCLTMGFTISHLLLATLVCTFFGHIASENYKTQHVK